MLSNKKIICPKKLIEIANKKSPVSAAIVNAGKSLPMHATMEAVSKKLIIPIFIGNQKEINNSAKKLNWDISRYEIIDEPIENNTALIAAKLAGTNKVKIIVKGHIHTDVLMKEVLKSWLSSFVLPFRRTYLWNGVVMRGAPIRSCSRKIEEAQQAQTPHW